MIGKAKDLKSWQAICVVAIALLISIALASRESATRHYIVAETQELERGLLP